MLSEDGVGREDSAEFGQDGESGEESAGPPPATGRAEGGDGVGGASADEE